MEEQGRSEYAEVPSGITYQEGLKSGSSCTAIKEQLRHTAEPHSLPCCFEVNICRQAVSRRLSSAVFRVLVSPKILCFNLKLCMTVIEISACLYWGLIREVSHGNG